MSMDHRAFVFDYEAFVRELRPQLFQLVEGEPAALDEFIDSHWPLLKHPQTRVPLHQQWRDVLTNPGIKGEAALTRYYDPDGDIGLHDDWMRTLKLLDHLLPSGGSVTLGEPIEHHGRAFDPRLQGTFFQSPALVRSNLARLDNITTGSDDEGIAAWREALVSASDRGLYVTF